MIHIPLNNNFKYSDMRFYVVLFGSSDFILPALLFPSLFTLHFLRLTHKITLHKISCQNTNAPLRVGWREIGVAARPKYRGLKYDYIFGFFFINLRVNYINGT